MLFVRRAGPEDIDEILRLERQAFRYDQLTHTAVRKHLVPGKKSSLTMVALDPDVSEITLLGFILLLRPERSRKAVIHSYAVDPTAQGKGVGAALLTTGCEEAAKTHPIIVTHVRVDSPHAHARYEKSGFRRIGEEAHYYGDGCDAYIYLKRYK